MIHFELFYHLVHRSQLNPKQYLFTFGSWKNIYILGIHLRKIITPVPFYSKAFVLPQKFETSWALLGRLSRGFFFSFAISGASNFKHSFTFHEPVLDLACLCESFLVESPILYLAFFKTILAALFGTLGLPLRFLLSKPSLLHDHFTTQHSDFPSF